MPHSDQQIITSVGNCRSRLEPSNFGQSLCSHNSRWALPRFYQRKMKSMAQLNIGQFNLYFHKYVALTYLQEWAIQQVNKNAYRMVDLFSFVIAYYMWREKEGATFDWFKSYADIAHIIRDTIPSKESRILMLGCGNSKLSEEVWCMFFAKNYQIQKADTRSTDVWRRLREHRKHWCKSLLYEIRKHY